MNINCFKQPFPHIIIDDVFTQNELAEIWNEIIFLDKKLLPPVETGAAVGQILENNKIVSKPLKNGNGIFLSSVYNRPNISDILKIVRKLFNDQIKEACKTTDLILEQLNYTTYDSTLLNKYLNDDYYLPHRDGSVVSITSVIHKTPKQYEGGELYFPDYNYQIDLMNNQSIIFPSCVKHGVTTVKMNSDDELNGRFSITQFVGFKPWK